MINNIFIAVRSKIRAEMNQIADDMVTGGCSDYPAYQRKVGIVEGLAVAERLLLDVEAQLKRSLDTEDEA